MDKAYDGGVFWLLDVRFDFLLPSFMNEFKIDEQDIILVNSYHGKTREKWRKQYIPSKKENVIFMEPDDINRIFSKELHLKRTGLVIPFSGVGLPQSDNVISFIATGQVAELCNDKWWQYNLFRRCNMKTPVTFQYRNLEEVKKKFCFLIGKYKKVLIKRPCLSGGYMMDVLDSNDGLLHYCEHIRHSGINRTFLVSEYIPHQQSFASMGVVRKNREVNFIDIVTEQVLYKEVAYEGLIYPAFLDSCHMEEIENMTIRIGRELGKCGYFGYYNIDYILADNHIYAVEINARLGFGTILAGCLYGQKIWEMLQGKCAERTGGLQKRLVIGKIKGRERQTYANLKSVSNISAWFRQGSGFFKTFFCGTDDKELLEYGSFIGLFGEFFPLEEARENILERFMERCLECY